jgi:hypothetical protein
MTTTVRGEQKMKFEVTPPSMGNPVWTLSFPAPESLTPEEVTALVQKALKEKDAAIVEMTNDTVTVTFTVTACWQWTNLREMMETIATPERLAVTAD